MRRLLPILFVLLFVVTSCVPLPPQPSAATAPAATAMTLPSTPATTSASTAMPVSANTAAAAVDLNGAFAARFCHPNR